MIRRIVVSPEAKDDIVSIFAEGIARHPILGQARPELGPGIRSLYRGSHLIYYLIESGELRIV